jgi:hypothetical protein
LDARSLVKSYEDLLAEENWLSSSGKSIAYNGMLVAVASTIDVSKNGLYFLFDINCTSNLKSPDVKVETNWLKVGETSDIGEFAERITKIEEDLEEFKDRLSVVEEKQTEVFAHRTTFPETGLEGKLYIAVDEQKSYVWIDTVGYLCVGEENPEVICGGTAD